MNRRWFVKMIGALPIVGVAGSPPSALSKKVSQLESLQLDYVPIVGMRYHPIWLYPLDDVMRDCDVHPA